MFNLYTGIPGSGKTLLAVLDVWFHLINGREVWSNTWINFKGDNLHYFNDAEDIVNKKGALNFFDEIGTIMGSREWQDTPKSVRQFLQLHRHRKIDIIATTIHASQVEKSARSIIGYWAEVDNLTPTEGLKGRKGIGHYLPFLFIQANVIDIRSITNEVPDLKSKNVFSKLFNTKVWWKKSFFDNKYQKYKIDKALPLYDTYIELDIPVKEKKWFPYYKCNKCDKMHRFTGNISSKEQEALKVLSDLSD
jgi:hypothetical protein